MGGGGDGTGMVWQDETKVREEKGRWRQNKTGDGNRTKQKQIGERRVCRAKDGAAGREWRDRMRDGAAGHGVTEQEMVWQDENGVTGQEMAVRTRDGVSGQDKKRTPGKGCAGVRN